MNNTASSPPRWLDLERLEDNKKLSRKREMTPKEEKLDGMARKDDVRSSIHSRMKRQAILEVDTIGSLKVRRRTVIHTGQSSRQQARKDVIERKSKTSSTSRSKKAKKMKSLQKTSLPHHHNLRMGGKPRLMISRSST
ncbi:hypothetical protein ACFX1X_002388 [Malus domestica]